MSTEDFPWISRKDFERWSDDVRKILDEIGREKSLDVEAIRREVQREIDEWEERRP